MKIWYAFMGGDPFDVNNYHRVTIKPGFLCGDQVCAIKVEDNGIHPALPFSNNIRSYITKALVRGMFQPETPYNAKPYVYMKDN